MNNYKVEIIEYEVDTPQQFADRLNAICGGEWVYIETIKSSFYNTKTQLMTRRNILLKRKM